MGTLALSEYSDADLYDSDDERSALCDVQQQHIGFDYSDDTTVRAVRRQVLNI